LAVFLGREADQVPSLLETIAQEEGIAARPQNLMCNNCGRFIAETSQDGKAVIRLKCGNCKAETYLVAKPDTVTIHHPKP